VPSPSHEREILQVPARYRTYPGVLTLTNQHLVFTRRTGHLSKRHRATLFLPLAAIGGVTASSESAVPAIIISVHPPPEAGPVEFVLELDSPDRVRDRILEQVERQRTRTAGAQRIPSSSPSISVVIQAPVVPGSPKIMVRCPYCHTVYPELDARCPSCGGHF
jgi:hypothetical protein